MWNRFAKAFSVISCVLLVLSALVVFLPAAKADTWTEDTDTDFADGDFWNTETVGTGGSASVQLKKNVPNWIEKQPPSPPDAREGAASCFSPGAGKLIVFGGYSGSYYNDTWEYNYSANTWTKVNTSASPSAREWAGMTYASYWGICVLFGGYDGSSFLTDTWEYDVVNQTWEETTPALGPPAMDSVALAYYASVYKVILFGEKFAGGMETWAYNPDTNAWLNRNPSNQPGDRSYFAMAYHAGIDRIVLYGGSYMLNILNDTWEYDYIPNTWSLKAAGVPASRYGHSMAYRSSDDSIILFGGREFLTYFDETWSYKYDAGSPSWTMLGTLNKPSARAFHVLEYDSVNDYILLFGGYDGGVRLNDTWALGMGYQVQGTYVSSVFHVDQGDVDWGVVWWNWTPAQQPEATELRIRIASSTVANPPSWFYVGPDGTTDTYYTFEGQEIWVGHDNHTYLRYQVTFLSFDGRYSPVFDNITITYTPIAVAPKIISTYPENIQLNVKAYQRIIVNFSKPMNTSSVTWTIDPYVGLSPSWTENDTKLILTHADPFQYCTMHEMNITNGTDKLGLPLIPGPAPNPWYFFVECPKPKIMSTDPAHMQTGVPLDKSIVITFNMGMNTSSLRWTIGPDEGLGWNETWSSGDSVVTLSHTKPFREWWRYQVEVTQAKSKTDQDLVPGPVNNPWWFETTGYSPYIESTDPAHNDTGVALNKAITIVFSEAMDIPTVNVTIDPYVPLTKSWVGNTQLTLTHTTNFLPCQAYSVGVTGKGLDGNDLVERYGYPPNPFTFMTTCTYPFIKVTQPYDGQQDVSIWKNITVLFSEEMRPETMTWTINPDPGGWSVYWEPLSNNSFVTLSHAVPFTYCTVYTVEITHAEDIDGNNIVPGPVPNPWTFKTFDDYPCILNTTPENAQTNVSLDADIWVNFSEPIDTTTLSWSITPGADLNWTETWSNGNKTLVLSHKQNFTGSQQYQVHVASARDMDGNDLVLGPAPNPWWFMTTMAPGYPYITYHYPYAGEENIPVDADVIVNFSEPMNTTTVTWSFIRQFTGDPVTGVVGTWSNNNTTLTLSHDPLVECDWFLVEITGGEDEEGLPLQPNPDPGDPYAVNPWQFKTACIYPYIVYTYPEDGDVGIPVDQYIMINFSEEMNTDTVTWNITPNPGGWTEVWSNGNSTLTLYHNTTPFAECTIHTVEVTGGKDLRGLPLQPGLVPNPWSFTTICLNPYIVLTDPADGDTDVPLDYPVTIGFSEPMNESTVTWTITPGLSNWTEVWNNDSTVLTIYHNNSLFIECAAYQMEVTGGEDLDGYPLIGGPAPLPNPWNFMTVCIPPYINKTDPKDGDVEIPLDYNVTIWFSEPMNPGTFMFDYTPNVPPLNWQKYWYDDNTTLVLTHSANFTTCTQYTMNVLYAEDWAGLALGPGPVPNPWSFTTVCPNPYIASTNPYHGQTDVPLGQRIQINFSKPMNTISVKWSLNPGLTSWTEVWSNNDSTLNIYHNASLFTEFTVYQAFVSEAYDKDGNPLMDLPGSAPNPWNFRTATIPSPMIVWTDPEHGETGVRLDKEIIANFSKPMDPLTVTWTVTGPGNISFTPGWSNGTKTLTLYHNLTRFRELSLYTVQIQGKDKDGKDLVAGPVPNPWSFMTGSLLPSPTGLTVSRDFLAGTVVLDWNPVAGADYYNVYESKDRFAAFPSGWTLYPNITGTTYSLPQLNDGLTHYYIVRAYSISLGEESTNSTMGVKFQKDFIINPLIGNIHWMSLPYVNIYRKASDITFELTSNNINVVGKWNRDKQKTEVYFYTRGKWRGTDFAINPGDGIYIGAVKSFSWVITGTDKDVSIDLPFSLVPTKLNKHWISVPSTGIYARASDIVMDIEGGFGVPTKIVEIGKWDPVTQGVIKYEYKGSWTGVDFVIEPGDGIYLKVITAFVWSPKLLTPYVG